MAVKNIFVATGAGSRTRKFLTPEIFDYPGISGVVVHTLCKEKNE